MKPVPLATILGAVFILGSFLGYAVGSRRAGGKQMPATGSGVTTESRQLDHSSATSTDRSAALAAENAQLRAELEQLRSQISAPTSSSTRSIEEKREYARKLYEALSRRHGSGIDNEESRELMKFYHQLDSDVTQVFIGRFLEKARDGKLDHVALDLILKAGGARASEFLATRLSSTDVGTSEREQLLLKSSGHLGTTNWLQSLPPSAQLETLSAQLAISADGLERAASAGILGCFSSPAAQNSLVNFINADKDYRVLLASVKSLARIGTSDSVPALQALTQRISADPTLYKGELVRAINGAIVSIQLREQK